MDSHERTGPRNGSSAMTRRCSSDQSMWCSVPTTSGCWGRHGPGQGRSGLTDDDALVLADRATRPVRRTAACRTPRARLGGSIAGGPWSTLDTPSDRRGRPRTRHGSGAGERRGRLGCPSRDIGSTPRGGAAWTVRVADNGARERRGLARGAKSPRGQIGGRDLCWETVMQ